MAADYLRSIEPILPGITAAWNGKAYYNIGLLDPHILGAWLYWRTGQYTTFAGYEGVAEGRAYFCGEHTEQEFQGFMEGAVRSGQRAAREISKAWQREHHDAQIRPRGTRAASPWSPQAGDSGPGYRRRATLSAALRSGGC